MGLGFRVEDTTMHLVLPIVSSANGGLQDIIQFKLDVFSLPSLACHRRRPQPALLLQARALSA